MAGNHAVIGILAALRHRDATGEGQHVEVNLLSSALTGLVNHSSAWVAGGVVPYRMGNAHPSVFPYEPLPDRRHRPDRDRRQRPPVRASCAPCSSIPEVAEDERFLHNADRTANRDELKPILAERLRTRKAAEWFDVLLDAGVPSGPINTIDGGLRDGRAVRARADRRGRGGRPRASRPPGTRSGSPARRSRTAVPPPELDEHGEELRAWLAGTRRPPMSEPARRTRPPWAPRAATRSRCSARTSPPT